MAVQYLLQGALQVTMPRISAFLVRVHDREQAQPQQNQPSGACLHLSKSSAAQGIPEIALTPNALQ